MESISDRSAFFPSLLPVNSLRQNVTANVNFADPNLPFRAETSFNNTELAPFIALTWCHAPAKRWSESARAALHFMTLVLALGSLAIYGYVALGPPRAKPAFFFLVIPPASLILIALVVAMRTKNEKA